MAIQILMKRVQSNGSYGDSVPFEIGIMKANAIESSRNQGELSSYHYEGETSIEGGTDLRAFKPERYALWQAFNTDGSKLGFQLMYFGEFWGNDGFILIQPETQALQFFSVASYGRDNRPIKLFVQKRYAADTLDEVLANAELLYNKGFEPYEEGMNTNKHSVLSMACFSPEENTWWGNSLSGEEVLNSSVKTRYFSTWYRMLNSKNEWYKQNELFAIPMVDGTKFYVGKALKWTENSHISEHASSMEDYERHDPSYVFTDVIFGHDIAFFCDQWGQAIECANGLRIGYEEPNWNNGNSPKWAYPYMSKFETGENFKINWRVNGFEHWTGPEGFSGFRGMFLSKIGPAFHGTFNKDWDANLHGIGLFISPLYNNFEYKSFKSTLESIEHTEDEWKKLLARVFTFAADERSNLSNEGKNLLGYGGTNQNASITFSGWVRLGSDSAMGCSNYYPGDTNLVNNFGSAEAWNEIIDFVNPGEEDDPPGPGPGPEPEPEPEDEEKEICIGTLAELSIKKGLPFLGDYEKLEKYDFMQEYVEDYTDFDYDLMETRYSFKPVCKQETLEKTLEVWRRRAAFTIKKHAKELEHLWEIAQADFDPIYNVEEHIEESTKHTGSDTLRDAIDSVTSTDSYGAKKTTDAFGAQSTTDSYGKQEGSNSIGAQTNSQNFGAKTTTVENERASMGPTASVYGKDNKATTAEGAQSNSSSTGARSDSATVEAHTDTHGSNAYTDTHSDDGYTDSHVTDYREDVHEQTYDNTVTRKYDRKGNVGTMSSPELLEKAANANEVFDFYNKLYDLVMRELAYYFDEGKEIL